MKKLLGAIIISLTTLTGTYAEHSIGDAFKNGKTTGELSLFTKAVDNSGSKADEAFTVGSFYVNYSTDSFKGLKTTLGIRANTLINKKNEADYDQKTKSVITEANLAYTTKNITIIAGRQPIELEWIEDYHNAIIGTVSLDNLAIVAGWTRAKGISHPDYLSEVKNIDNDNGVYILDTIYSIDNTTKIGAYYIAANEIFSAFGGKVEGTLADINITLKYAQTNEDKQTQANGNIMALDLGYKVSAVKFQIGYITTDKEGGAGSLKKFGDKIKPFDAGNKIYNTDADTLYFGINTKIKGFDIYAVHGITDYKNTTNNTKETESEFNLLFSKEVAKNTKINFMYVSINGEATNSDSDYAALQLAYAF